MTDIDRLKERYDYLFELLKDSIRDPVGYKKILDEMEDIEKVFHDMRRIRLQPKVDDLVRRIQACIDAKKVYRLYLLNGSLVAMKLMKVVGKDDCDVAVKLRSKDLSYGHIYDCIEFITHIVPNDDSDTDGSDHEIDIDHDYLSRGCINSEEFLDELYDAKGLMDRIKEYYDDQIRKIKDEYERSIGYTEELEYDFVGKNDEGAGSPNETS